MHREFFSKTVTHSDTKWYDKLIGISELHSIIGSAGIYTNILLQFPCTFINRIGCIEIHDTNTNISIQSEVRCALEKADVADMTNSIQREFVIDICRITIIWILVRNTCKLRMNELPLQCETV